METPNKYKAELRIPLEQYEYVNINVEGTPEEILTAHQEFTRLLRAKEGLPHLEWNKVLDSYLQTNTMKAEDYESLAKWQKLIIQELKKSFKRITKE